MQITYGVDEAGRGPILGPMVLAVVGLTDEQAQALAAAGVQDSKGFGSGPRGEAKRAALAELIGRTASCTALQVVDVATIDARVAKRELNTLEQEVAVSLLRTVGAPRGARIIADGYNLFRPLIAEYPALLAVNGGESVHTSVAAASILAKHARDLAWRSIAAHYAAEYGPIAGGGYLNPPTRRFLDAFKAKHGTLPLEARMSWKLAAE